MVQEQGLRMLERLDNIHRAEETVDTLRRTLVISGERPFREVFSEYFRTPSTDELPEEEILADDEEAAIYDYSQADLDIEQAVREIEALTSGLADDHVVVSGDQPLRPGEWV